MGVAGGGEAVVDGTIGLGGELGLLAGRDVAALLVSSGASVRFGRQARTTSFASAGYTFVQAFVASGHAYYVGGDLDYRLRARRSLRAEVRRLAGPHRRGSPVWMLRVGMAFQ